MFEQHRAYFKSDVPVGESGSWSVERFNVQDRGVRRGKDSRPDFARRKPGSYTLLQRGRTVFMTDLYDEWWTQRAAIEEAGRRGGQVLITGLGLGMIVESMLRDPAGRVEGITVLERSPHVIRLVGPHLQARYGRRLEVCNVDAFAWRPPGGARFTVGWHDIWPEPYGEKVRQEEERLLVRYRDCCDWQGCWPREYLACYKMAAQSPGVARSRSGG